MASDNRNSLKIDPDRVDTASIVLDKDSVSGLSPIVREEIKKKVGNINRAWEIAGQCIRTVAAELHSIRMNTKQGNWDAIASNDLVFSKAIADDLIVAHQWLSNSQIPDRFLSNISARTLRTIAAEKDEKLKEAITQEIISKEGMGFSEVALRELMKEYKGSDPKKVAKKILNKAKKELPADASKEEVLKFYKAEVNSVSIQINNASNEIKEKKKTNDKLAKANAELKKEIAKLKKQIPTTQAARDLLTAVKEDNSSAALVMNAIKEATAKKEETADGIKKAVESISS
jgi:hypothetical protein